MNRPRFSAARRTLPLLVLVAATQCTRTATPNAGQFQRAAEQAAAAARRFLESMDTVTERLAPDRLAALAQQIGTTHAQPLRDARAALDNAPPPPELRALAEQIREAWLLHGLAHPDEYRALAPLCGVLHPANEEMGNLRRARGMPIYLVHGAQDFLFPVQRARLARDALSTAGALVEYRELAELSHTYPRSENVRILRWFEALPPP